MAKSWLSTGKIAWVVYILAKMKAGAKKSVTNAHERLACRIVCPWCLRQFFRGVALAFTVDLEYTVNTLFKVRAVTMQALLQHPFHALRPVYQRVHLGQLSLRQALPACR